MEEETVQDPRAWMTCGRGLSPGLLGVKDTVDRYTEALSLDSPLQVASHLNTQVKDGRRLAMFHVRLQRHYETGGAEAIPPAR